MRYLEFEKPIETIDNKINSLNKSELAETSKIQAYEAEKEKLFKTIYNMHYEKYRMIL